MPPFVLEAKKELPARAALFVFVGMCRGASRNAPASDIENSLIYSVGAHKVLLKLKRGISDILWMLMSYASFMCLKQKRADRPVSSLRLYG
jgi:hypothetical protein